LKNNYADYNTINTQLVVWNGTVYFVLQSRSQEDYLLSGIQLSPLPAAYSVQHIC